ncbi:MAG: hypothetical protein AMDU3_IPLC00001G0214 [Thermoplasmatales archaeon I-plasma]|nr:MAG: hypothetical protein AMDU3_IPLC00001G0214 [Thermoplasmatales archaeon I-plasma]
MDRVVGQDPIAKTSSELEALRNIRTFSILSFFGFATDAVVAILALLSLPKLLTSFPTPSSAHTASFVSLGIAFSLGGLGIAAALLMILSFVFLRRGYRALKGVSKEFSSPYTGVNMFFIGLLVIILGSIIIIPLALFSTSAIALSIGIIAVLVIGSILAFIGEILALIVGPFRLGTYFNKSTFRTAGIMMIIGLFVPFISIAGVVLIYSTANSVLRITSQVI